MDNSPVSTRPSYYRQLEEARRRSLVLSAEAEADLLALLADYAERLAARIATGLPSQGERRIAAELDAIFNELALDMARRTGSAVRRSARETAELHARATASLMESPGAVAAFQGVAVVAVEAVLSRPELAEAFRTIRRDGAAGANRIIRDGILRGAPTRTIARELRMYVGAPGSLVEGDAVLLRDRRRIGYRQLRELGYDDPSYADLLRVRKQARTVANKAGLIARTETVNAYHEAAVQAGIDSPVVGAQQWLLTATHGRRVGRDVCDVIAETNWYGLGPGVFPPGRVPAKPHPRDLCYLRSVLRPAAEWGQPKRPAPPQLVGISAATEGEGLAPSAVKQLRAAWSVGRRAGDARRPAGATA